MSRVLIVVDMQQDYDIAANVALYGEVKSPTGYANDITRFVPIINEIRQAVAWDRVVFTLDWLPAEMLAGRTPFCLEDTPGAGLLDGLIVSASDIFFRKNSDDSFCDVGGSAEETTGCDRLANVLAALGYGATSTSLTFVGQRFERCMLKTAMHARHLGYSCSIVESGTYAKTDAPDPEWTLAPAASLPSASDMTSAECLAGATPCPSWAEDVYARTRKSAGAQLARGYLAAAGVLLCPMLEGGGGEEPVRSLV